MSPSKNDPIGNPPAELKENNAAVRALESAVRVLETHKDIMAAAAETARKDLQDARDRVIRLEVKIDALPTKGWMGKVVVGAITVTGTLVAIVATILHLIWH